MSNTFYELLLRTQNGTNRVRQNVQSGLSADYSITYPNIAPLNRRSLRFNSSTGIFDWVESPSTDVRFECSVTEPTSRTDGMIWLELNNHGVTDYWEWDASNSVWWSQPKLMTFEFHLKNGGESLVAHVKHNHNAQVRKHILLRAGYTFQVFVANDAVNNFSLVMRTFNNVGAIVNIFVANSSGFTQNNNTGAVYRASSVLTSFNNAGTGRITFLDNIFAIDSYILAATSLVDRQPYGEMFLLYRHERRTF